MNQKGFINILIVILIAVVVGVVGYFVLANKPVVTNTTESPSTQVISPDNNQTPEISPSVTANNPPPQSNPLNDPRTNWKTYRNDMYGFEFKYPPNWLIKNLGSNLVSKSYKGLSPNIPAYSFNLSCDILAILGVHDDGIEIYDPKNIKNKITIFLANFSGRTFIARQTDDFGSVINIDNLVKFQNSVESFRSSDEIFESIFFDLSQLKSKVRLMNKNYLFVSENELPMSLDEGTPLDCKQQVTNLRNTKNFVAYESIDEPLGKKLYRFIQIDVLKNQSEIFNNIKSSISFFQP